MEFGVAERGGDRRGWALIFDISTAIVNVSSTDVQALAAMSARDLDKSAIGPVVIIASRDSMFGLGRMFQTYSDISGRTNVGVVRSKEDAQRWLTETETSIQSHNLNQTAPSTSGPTGGPHPPRR
jgi:hypothetical protein